MEATSRSSLSSNGQIQPRESHAATIGVDSQNAISPEQLERHGLELSSTGYVQWRRDCKDHPRNWTVWRKLYDTTTAMFFELYTTAISTTGPSAAEAAEGEYTMHHIGRLVAFSLTYQIGQALGGLFLPSCSELFGRRIPYVASCFLYSMSCLVTGAVPHVGAVFVGRFFAGIASAVPSIVVAGTVEDLYNSERRVWLMLLWNGATTAGLAIGPIYAAYILEATSWRYIFYSAAIVTGANNILLFGMRESRPSILLRSKIAALSLEAPDADLKYHSADPFPNLAVFIEVVLARPSRMMVIEPILIIVTLLGAIAAGIIYLFTESLMGAYQALGMIPHIWDIHNLRRKKQQNLQIDPEDKVLWFALGTPALAVGLWWFYATTPPAIEGNSFMIPTGALVLVGLGVNEIAYTLSGYLTDTYTVYSASAFSGLAFVRALVSGIMPLIGYAVFDESRTKTPGFVLSAIATLFCLVPLIFARLGRLLRIRSSFAKHSLEVNQLTQVGEI
ncbi:hypothetical protein N7485_010829 [Penicillium canescens]|nr:hypothetical protein N7485_010829 [Penicillium canescens]